METRSNDAFTSGVGNAFTISELCTLGLMYTNVTILSRNSSHSILTIIRKISRRNGL